MARHLENSGFLDFEPVCDSQIPALCHRAGCWPDGMPQTVAPAQLGLDQATVEKEERHRERERQRRDVEKRSINFAGITLDTADPSFVEEFRNLAETSIAGDSGWFKRSRRPKLTEFVASESSGRSSVGGPGRGVRRRKPPPEDVKQAMGLAGEWLAFEFLRRRHSEGADETCWVSGNRVHFLGGNEGDDAAGYDFCVRTAHAEWLYEVKSSPEDACEFELTANEMRVAASVSRRGRRRYRILYVPFVFSPDRWLVLELPNPMGDGTRNRFKAVGQGSVRFRFEHSAVRHATF